jgi:hypothetical protein
VCSVDSSIIVAASYQTDVRFSLTMDLLYIYVRRDHVPCLTPRAEWTGGFPPFGQLFDPGPKHLDLDLDRH